MNLTLALRNPKTGEKRFVFDDRVVIKLFPNVEHVEAGYSVKIWDGPMLKAVKSHWNTTDEYEPTPTEVLQCKDAFRDARKVFDFVTWGLEEAEDTKKKETHHE